MRRFTLEIVQDGALSAQRDCCGFGIFSSRFRGGLHADRTLADHHDALNGHSGEEQDQEAGDVLVVHGLPGGKGVVAGERAVW